MEVAERNKRIYKVTVVGSIVNLLLIIFKFAAGILGRSSAMIADAVHSLSDFITDVIVIAFVKISGRPNDKDHEYGHGKYETLAALLIGVILLLVGFGIAYNGLFSIISVIKGEELPAPGMIALIGALVSILMKEGLFQYTVIEGRRLKSDAVIANAWHHRSDALSSIATTIGIGGAILLGNKWTILDPLAGVLVSIFIMTTAVRLIKPSLDELMERSLPESSELEIRSIVEKFEGVYNFHNLYTRKIGGYYAIEFAICMNGDVSVKNAHEIISTIEDKLREQFGDRTHIMIHVEPL